MFVLFGADMRRKLDMSMDSVTDISTKLPGCKTCFAFYAMILLSIHGGCRMRLMLQINEDWFFFKDHPENLKDVPIDAKTVCLPHTWNGIDGQDGGNDYFRGTCCYAKKIHRAQLPVGERYFLEINGANSSADVYLNGVHLRHHDGGYSTWRVDLTKGLQDENLLVIMVDNAPNETVYPQHADFTFYGGLYRGVRIIAVPETHFELLKHGHPGIHVTSIVEGSHARVTVDAPAVNLQPGDQIHYYHFAVFCAAGSDQGAF